MVGRCLAGVGIRCCLWRLRVVAGTLTPGRNLFMAVPKSQYELAVPTKTSFFLGWTLTILPSLLLIFSGVMKLVGHFTEAPEMVQGFTSLGLRPDLMLVIGVIELFCVLLYLIPKTAVLGAILITGYMGGAILTHLRVGDLVIAQIVLGVVVWLGLYLREPRLRVIAPLR